MGGTENGSWNVCRIDLPPQTPGTEHDSLIGDRRKMKFNRFREVVVLDPERVYVAFIVWYTRKSARSSSSVSADDAPVPSSNTSTCASGYKSGGVGSRSSTVRRQGWQHI